MFNLNIQIVIAPFVEKTILSPHLWVKKPGSIYVWVPLWALCPFHFISCQYLMWMFNDQPLGRTLLAVCKRCERSYCGWFQASFVLPSSRPHCSFIPFSPSLPLSFFLLALFSYSLPLSFSRICIPQRKGPNVCLRHCLEMPDTQ